MESVDSQLDASRNVTKMVLKYFPHTPVVPVYGNHEVRHSPALPLSTASDDGGVGGRDIRPTCTTCPSTAGSRRAWPMPGTRGCPTPLTRPFVASILTGPFALW
jgi:hypothetical protein